MNICIKFSWILIAGFYLLTASWGIAADERNNNAQQKNDIKNGDNLLDSELKKKQTLKLPKALSKEEKDMAPDEMIIYTPPLRGAPVNRIAGGTRGNANGYPFLLCVLTPEHTGLTAQAQPSLYWFISEQVKYPIEFTLIEDHAIQPIIEKQIPAPQQLGVQCIRLNEYNISLQLNWTYKWFITLVPDQERRSKDILAWEAIKRVELQETIQDKLATAAKEKIPHIYAKAGIWYDAFSSISELIENNPNNIDFKIQRAFLLEQVGLFEIAQYDIE